MDWAIAISILGAIGGAIGYVINLWMERSARHQRYFVELMQMIDGAGPIAGKMAAIYELRSFESKHDFIIRFCNARDQLVTGETSNLLKQEMAETVAFLTAKQ